MSRRVDDPARAFPPDYVSAETLAHRLDCSISTVHAYVRRGLLPRPVRVGDLVRWRWSDVDRFIHSLEATREARNNDDPYLTRLGSIEDGASKKTVS